jgi:AcrR family transcriptional regulator
VDEIEASDLSSPALTAKRHAGGRKRDPLMEPKVFAAALRVYAAEGWSGFTFDAVAREAGVGKPAIYLRWHSQEDLLVHAFGKIHFPTARDCGSLREDVLDYALQWAEWFADPVTASAAHRIRPDCEGNPELAAMYQKIIVRPKHRAATAIARRAIARGELAADIPAMTIVEILIGSMQLHWTYAKSAKGRSLKSLTAYATTLVDIILTGVLSLHKPSESATAGVMPPEVLLQLAGTGSLGLPVIERVRGAEHAETLFVVGQPRPLDRAVGPGDRGKGSVPGAPAPS